MPDFQRKRNRLRPDSYRGRRAYFLTLCANERRKMLADTLLVERLIPILRATGGSHSFNVNAYCFMPDHLHLIVLGQSDSASLPRFMQAFKSLAARETRKLGIAKPWQKGFYDHVLSDGESLDAASLYAFLNPVRAGLVQRAEEWPFSGSFMFAWPNVPVASTPFVPPWKREGQTGCEKKQMAR
jgi:putative transposase